MNSVDFFAFGVPVELGNFHPFQELDVPKGGLSDLPKDPPISAVDEAQPPMRPNVCEVIQVNTRLSPDGPRVICQFSMHQNS